MYFDPIHPPGPVSLADAPEPSAQGTFAKTPLSHVFLYALEEKLTGTIEFSQRTGLAATVLFVEGLPTKARTTLVDYYLGRAMVDLGFLTEEQHVGLLPRLLMSEQLHGEALVAKGIISTEQLRRGLERQLDVQLRALADLPPDTIFKYFDAFDALASYGSDADVRLDPYPVIWASLRAQPPWDHIQPILAGVGNLALKLGGVANTDRFSFDKLELDLVALLRQRPHRLHELSEASAMEPRAVLVLVYCLIVTKQVAAVSGSSMEGSVPPPALHDEPPAIPPAVDSAPVTPVVLTQAPITPVVDADATVASALDGSASAPDSERPTAPPPPVQVVAAKSEGGPVVRQTLRSVRAIDDVHTRTTLPQMTALTRSEIAAYIARQEALTGVRQGPAPNAAPSSSRETAPVIVNPNESAAPLEPNSGRPTMELRAVTLEQIDEAFSEEAENK